MDTTIHKQALLEKIRDTIKNFVDGDISSLEAGNAYEQLHQEAVLSNRASADSSGHFTDFFQKLFASHNISNFCKLTCEVSVSSGDMEIVHASGSESLLSIVKNEMLKEKNKITTRSIFSFPPFKLEGLDYRAFIIKSAAPGNERFLISLTSSKYSQEEIFQKFSSIINSYYTLSGSPASHGTDSIYDKVRNDTVNTIKQYIGVKVAVKAMLYRFDNIYEIFEHRGLKTLLDIDSRIVKSLQNYHGYEASVTILGPSIYLVLLPVEDRGEEKKTRAPARLLFGYEDVIFRYWVYRKIINNEAGAISIFYWISETLKEADGS